MHCFFNTIFLCAASCRQYLLNVAFLWSTGGRGHVTETVKDKGFGFDY